MKEKIYFYNKGTKALHIKDFCKNGNVYDCKSYYTEQEAIEDNGKYIHMCIECEERKEKLLQQAVKNSNKQKGVL